MSTLCFQTEILYALLISPCMLHVPPSHSSWFEQSVTIRWSAQIVEFLTVSFPLTSCSTLERPWTFRPYALSFNFEYLISSFLHLINVDCSGPLPPHAFRIPVFPLLQLPRFLLNYSYSSATVSVCPHLCNISALSFCKHFMLHRR